MKKYRDAFTDNPYRVKLDYPYRYAWRLLTPTGKPSAQRDCLHVIHSKHLLTEHDALMQYNKCTLPIPRKGYRWSGPYSL